MWSDNCRVLNPYEATVQSVRRKMLKKHFRGIRNKRNIDGSPISVLFRDINGRRSSITFPSWDEVGAISELLSDGDEILVVTIGGQIIWASLGSTDSLTMDDLTGFFA